MKQEVLGRVFDICCFFACTYKSFECKMKEIAEKKNKEIIKNR